MSSLRLYGGLATLLFLLSCCPAGFAADPSSTGTPTPGVTPATQPPGTLPPGTLPSGTDIGPSDIATPAPVAYPVALPVEGNGEAPLIDASEHRKFYTITAYLRETYDDNVNTSVVKKASFETGLSPSILCSFPTPSSTFSARYTLNLLYYGSPGSTLNSSGDTLEISHEFVAGATHAFSDRFNLSVGEDFRYFTEPSIFESTGTLYRNGAYISNAFNLSLNSQLTPLLGTSTSFANSIVRYDEQAVAQYQDNVEYTGTHVFSLTVLPTLNVDAGGTVDVIGYTQGRGYTNYTGFGGLSWQISDEMSLSGRIGASYTENNQIPGSVSQQNAFSPYAALSYSWKTGAKTSLALDYAHEITPTDEIHSDGQVSDRVTASAHYSITNSLGVTARGILTHASLSYSYINSGSTSFDENDYALSLTFSYTLNNHIVFDTGVLASGVDSQVAALNYTRNQAYIGVRGTY